LRGGKEDEKLLPRGDRDPSGLRMRCRNRSGSYGG
jgi:hypothetical protein